MLNSERMTGGIKQGPESRTSTHTSDGKPNQVPPVIRSPRKEKSRAGRSQANPTQLRNDNGRFYRPG
jgi:hypothetical protein